jgi:hypothetical protein
MRLARSLPILFLLAGLGAASAARPPALSWGKPGISYETYRADATACLRVAAATDLTGTEPANALVLASRRIETGLTTDYTPMVSPGGPAFAPVMLAVNRVARERIAARPDLRIRQARNILQSRLDACLAAHGYRRFRLTDAQKRQLDHFDPRRPERQVYLHSLASDPQVLATQAVAAEDISSRDR